MHLDDDTGNATLATSGIIAAILSLLLVIVHLSQGMIAAHRSQVAAELSAVAAAHALYRGTASPCDTAKEVATRNSADLRDCRIVEADVQVSVAVGGRVTRSKAGPL